MKEFHLNLGSAFAQPYESAYAMFRRCLIANPGIPLTAIKLQLRRECPYYTRNIERLYNKQLYVAFVDYDKTFNRWRDYGRQCPKCARLLYHTDLYALPWLSRCPLHHCVLSRTCPVCQQPWPRLQELPTRLCPGCGIFTLAELDKSIITQISHQRYDIIGELYAFIRSDKKPFLSASEKDRLDRYSQTWWKTPTLTSTHYPTYHIHRDPRISAKTFQRVNIEVRDLRYKVARLQRTDPHEHVPWYRQYLPEVLITPISEQMDQVMPPRLEYNFLVMQRVVTWIARQTGHKHTIHVDNYRFFRINDLIKGPNPCPFCLAFSLWIFHAIAVNYSEKFIVYLNHFPFCYEAENYLFLESYKPKIWFDNPAYYVSETFASWFYRRGLEISFLAILQFAFRLLIQLDRLRKDRKDKVYFEDQVQNLSDRLYWAEINDDKLYFYYEHEHPLDRYIPDTISNLDELCHAYHVHHDKYKIDKGHIAIETISNGGLTYDEFYDLHTSIKCLLEDVAYKPNIRKALKSFWSSYRVQ